MRALQRADPPLCTRHCRAFESLFHHREVGPVIRLRRNYWSRREDSSSMVTAQTLRQAGEESRHRDNPVPRRRAGGINPGVATNQALFAGVRSNLLPSQREDTHMLHNLLFAALLSLSAGPQVSSSNNPTIVPSELVQATGRNPYRNLFTLGVGDDEAPRKVPTALKEFPTLPSVREKRCTIVIIPADPTFDPKIRVPLRDQADGHHTLRVLPPPCVATPGVRR
jgi:hypothetical protein